MPHGLLDICYSLSFSINTIHVHTHIHEQHAPETPFFLVTGLMKSVVRYPLSLKGKIHLVKDIKVLVFYVLICDALCFINKEGYSLC